MVLDKSIEALLKDFYNISRMRVSIHDVALKEIYSYPAELTPFCSCVQSLPKLREDCLKSDAVAFSVVSQTNEPYIYKCKCGLYEAVAPIYNYGNLTGYLMLGQIRDSDTELIDSTRQYLIGKGLDSDLVNSAYDDIVFLTMEALKSYINIMTVIAEHITKSNKLTSQQNTLPFLIRKEIINNYAKNLTLPDLAKKFGCSVATMTTAFKAEYNMSIHRFLINTRLESAVEMLKSSDKTVKEISEECGFYDQNHFYRSFKSRFNMSPVEYRKRQPDEAE